MPLGHKESQCAVVGHGSWATAIVKMLLETDNHVNWYVSNPEIAAHLKQHHTNPKYLSEVHFGNDRLTVCDDINRAIETSKVIILAVPSAFLKGVADGIAVSLEDKFVISAIKGIVPDEYLTVAEYINKKYSIPFDRIGIITGPSHAEEIALERLSYLTIVCKNEQHAALLGKRFKTHYTKITASTDIYGAEYSAVLKNIYAIAVGICHGLGYGDNFLAVLISNSALETERFLNTTFPFDRNTNYSAYLGDLLVTCYSQFSRNRTFGMMIGKGYAVSSAKMELNMIAEGYYSAACIHHINQQWNVEMPIVDTVYEILYQGKSPAATIRKILDKLK